MIATAAVNAGGRPKNRAASFENRSNARVGFIRALAADKKTPR
ncbi:hypothetical protein AZ78_1598 [Lysobacter capsici AZ78]|uniref:Uncharacterized protein n=1 Tax=Lysobacter capsici AZ78 TaxID=1444315 RepID=A0A108U7P7_9GAMM|nr:hypothetical protein AZ78_1598 [Lysobacter capsici AZ78]